MKRLLQYTKFVGVALVLFSLHLWPWGSSPAKPDQPMNNNSNVNTVTNNITVDTDVTTEVAHIVYTQLAEGVHEVKERIKRAYESAVTTAQSYVGSISRGKLILWTLLGGYVTGVGTNYYLQSYLSYPLRWFRWNEHMSLEDLFAVPQDKLGNELVKEIQRRYTNILNPVDFITPFITFMRDIEAERRSIELFKRLGVIEKRLYISRLMFYDNKMLELCDKWLERVSYLNATFLHWMADFKFLHNARAFDVVMKSNLQGQRMLRLGVAVMNDDFCRWLY